MAGPHQADGLCKNMDSKHSTMSISSCCQVSWISPFVKPLERRRVPAPVRAVIVRGLIGRIQRLPRACGFLVLIRSDLRTAVPDGRVPYQGSVAAATASGTQQQAGNKNQARAYDRFPFALPNRHQS